MDDHASACLIDAIAKKSNPLIESSFTSETKEEALSRSEKSMHKKQQQQHELYYKEIGAELLNYDHVVLFGPTNAKTELHNYLKQDLHFKDIQIDVESTDKMTDNEKDAFVKSHFELL